MVVVVVVMMEEEREKKTHHVLFLEFFIKHLLNFFIWLHNTRV